MKALRALIPPPIQAEVPERILVRYRAHAAQPVAVSMEAVRRAAAGFPFLEGFEIEGVGATLTLTRTTLVLGVVRREVEETLRVYTCGGTRPSLELHCAPQSLHDAHAAGFGGAIAFAAAAGLAGGPVAGVAILMAGFLVAFTAREHALLALRRQLRELAAEMGSELWPDLPGELDWIESADLP